MKLIDDVDCVYLINIILHFVFMSSRSYIYGTEFLLIVLAVQGKKHYFLGQFLC